MPLLSLKCCELKNAFQLLLLFSPLDSHLSLMKSLGVRQMMEMILILTHLFWCLHLFNWRTCKCKKTQESSWRYLSSKAPLYMLPSIGQILKKNKFKIDVCLISRKTTKKSFYHTHKWQFGNIPYNWKGSWWGIHNLIPSILNDLQQNYRLLIPMP